MIFGISTRPSLSRDFAMLSVIILLGAVMLSLWVAYTIYEDHAEKTITLLENETVRIDRSLIVQIKNAAYILESFGRQIGQHGADDREHTARLFRSYTNESMQGDVFSWVDPAQRVTVSSNRGVIKKPVDVSDRDYVKLALAEPWVVQIGRPILGRVSEKWVLPLSIGVTDEDGSHAGIVVLSLNVDSLTNEIRSDIKKSGIHFAILSKTLLPLTERENDEQAISEMPMEALSIIDFTTSPSGILSQAGLFKTQNSYARYEVSAKYPYIILLEYDENLTSKQISEMLLPRIFGLAALSFFLISLLWAVRQRIIRPVEALTERAADIIRGERYQELDTQVPLEIEQLAENIRKLDQFLKERERSEEELIIKNAYLRRVKETSQLIGLARKDFLGSLADELQKPVEYIRDYVEALKEQEFGPIENEVYVKHAFEIHNNMLTLSQMIADIDYASGIERDTLVLYEKPTQPAFVVHRALRHFQEQAQYRHIEVKLRLDEDLPKLVIDEDRFNQILVNLFCAAASQLSPGSALILESVIDKNQRGEDEFVFMLKYNALSDQKKSGDLDSIRRIQLISEHDSNTPLFVKSEGINLALTRMLVKLHQGDIETQVSNNHVCRVYVRFPESRIHRASKKPADSKQKSA